MGLSLLSKRVVLKKPIKVSEANANDFKGEWLAIIDDKIVAHNKNASLLIKATKKSYEGAEPEFFRVCQGNIAMY